MMIHHFNCPPQEWNKNRDGALIFDWDDETGEVTGPSAGEILGIFGEGHVHIHPYPAGHDLTSLKSKADLAAIVGDSHTLPPELAAFYPEVEDTDPNIYDMDGNVVGQVVF
ncbi:MAG: hypothetical protein LBI68_01940 [Azoarcus sp.]|jgi:hypothetical protein|nr:hypothetical protein [Azoarcus sp.]